MPIMIQKFKSIFYFTLLNQDINKQIEVCKSFRDLFIQELEPTATKEKMYKTLVVGIKSVSHQEVEKIYLSLREYFAEKNTVIGAFYNNANRKGAHNNQFAPNVCPVPFLVIRYKIPIDIIFHLEEPLFIKNYLKTFELKTPQDVVNILKENNLQKTSPKVFEYIEENIKQILNDHKIKCPNS